MRPPSQTHQAKSYFLNLIIAAGLFSGTLITSLIWLKVPNEIISPLSWLCFGLIGLGSFLYLRKTITSRSRWVTVLAALAAVSLVYLFPELFGPTCGGMPRAFASPSTQCGSCLDYVCEWSNKIHDWHCYCDEWDSTGCVTDQPPTIQGALSCSQWGQNGWCTGSFSLELNATEPQGKEVMISGDVNGTAFACPSASASSTCSVPLPEGSGTANYIATSATRLTASGSSNFQHDSVEPLIDGWLSGTGGNNGWFVSLTEITASASDPEPASGMASFEYNLNSAGWENYTGPLSLSDGVHSLNLRASDVAGNIIETNQTIQVDTTTPTLDVSAVGTVGTNSWYLSDVQVSATASDSGSGLGSFEYNLNSTGWTTYSDPIELTDGTHSLSLRVIDNAGNTTEGSQTFQIDTIAPEIDLSVVGTEGENGWYISAVQVSASASDTSTSLSAGSVSGVAALEVSVDSGTWNTYSAPLDFNDGLYTYQFRATDNAGHLTETTIQQLQVDTIPPVIDLPAFWKLGQATTFKVQDDGSGLASVRVVIEDEDERYPKVTWDEKLRSVKFKGEIDWNGRFKDGQQAPPDGEYYAWVKVSDAAGNESRQAAQIIIPLVSFVEELISPLGDQTNVLISGTESSGDIAEQQQIPLSVVPTKEPSSQSLTKNAPPPISFGGGSNGAAQPSGAQSGATSFNAGGLSNSPVSNSQSNVLWAATATAAIGAFAAEIARRKEAEKAARRAANAVVNQARKRLKAAYTYYKSLEKQRNAERRQANQDKRFNRKEALLETAQIYTQTKKEEFRDRIRAGASEIEDEKKLDYQDPALPKSTYVPPDMSWKQADMAAASVAAKEIANAKKQENKKNWWEKAIDWIDTNQVVTSIGIGVAIGLGAAAIILTGGAAAPILIGAVALAGGITGGGTIALNAHYGRNWNENLIRNTVLSVGTTILTAGATVIGAKALGAGMTFCTMNPTCSSFIDPAMKAVDFIEETSLVIKAGVQTFFGDMDGASETLVELELEHLDGGMPGNSIAKELGGESVEVLTQYGDDAIELISKYGDDAIDLITKYGDDAVDIISTYGDEGIALLSTHGDDAINILNKIEKLSDDALEKAWQQGPDAMKALSYWDEEDLIKYGDELVSRAAQDAKALKAASELAKMKNIDSPEARELINTISENSIIGDGDKLILGKWVEGSLDDGFIGKARSESALFYGTNPGLQKTIDSMKDISKSEKEKLFWAINEQVLQKAVDSKWKIDYSFNGFDSNEIRKEMVAIEAIIEGESQEVIEKIYDGKFPFRMREVQFLVNNGYTHVVDEATGMIHWVRP